MGTATMPAIGAHDQARLTKFSEEGKNMKLIKDLLAEDSGQDLIEYALIAALIGLGCIGSLSGLANTIGNTFNGGGTALSNATA